MDKKILCNVLTPERIVYEGEIEYAVVPAYDGEMGFLVNHAPLISELSFGEVRLRNGNEKEFIFVDGGFVEIKDNEMIILTERAKKREELSIEEIESKLKELFVKEKPKELKERELMEFEIKKLKMCLKVASR